MNDFNKPVTDRISKSSVSITELNLERSPKSLPRPFGEGSRQAAGRFCRARMRSSTRFLAPRKVSKHFATRFCTSPLSMIYCTPSADSGTSKYAQVD